ncbi:unnamed protein product [Cylindrotheca closterium]|uniref:Uncharacterized protein n=1 Tax=Cylindrotheca closterium TaxID=2856 RepID=A0AAD2FC90_9STRA|nr:unnamed protein product [Cylindrotheca closterium]
MKIPSKPGAVRRNSSSSDRPQKRNSFRGQDPLGQALIVASPPSSTSSRKLLKKKTSIPTAPSLMTTAKKSKVTNVDPTSVSMIARRKLGKEGLSEYQKEQQAKKDSTIINNMHRKLSEKCLDVDDEGMRKKRMESLRKHLKRQVYLHLPTSAFKTYWHLASEKLEEDVRIRRYEMEEKKKKTNKRKRSSDRDMSIPRKRSSIGSVEGDDMAVPRKRPSIGSVEGDMTIPRKRPSIGSVEGDGEIPRIPKKRPSIIEETSAVVDLVDTDDEHDWGDEGDAESQNESPLQHDKPQEAKRKEAPATVVQVPEPVVIDPFEGAGPNRWANLIIGSKYQGEVFACGDWDTIQPV